MMGHWEKIETSWHETQVVYCRLCGQMIPRDIWADVIDGERCEFCGPECQDLYVNYWRPRYARPNTTSGEATWASE